MQPSRSLRQSKPTVVILVPWLSWLALILLIVVFSPFTIEGPIDFASIAVFVHLAIFASVLIAALPRAIGLVLSASLIVRCFLVFWDLHMRHVFPLVHSGNDSEGFYAVAVRVSEEPYLLGESIYGGVFSKMYGLLFYLIGPARAFAQYTNALFGVTAIIVVYLALVNLLKVEVDVATRIVAIGAFLPNTLILSSIFLRESIIVLLLSVSASLFILWFINGRLVHLGLAIFMALVSATFHSGTVAVAFGYLIVAIIYQRSEGRFRFGFSSLKYLVLLSPIVFLVLFTFPEILLGKFDSLESTDDIIGAVNTGRGDSAYLTGMNVDSFGELFLFGPIRALYFLGAPMPWDWRGPIDVMTGLLDSSFYLGVTFIAFRNRGSLGERRGIVIALLIVIACASLLFGVGVGNAGTALRHRYKIVSLFLITLALALKQPAEGERLKR